MFEVVTKTNDGQPVYTQCATKEEAQLWHDWWVGKDKNSVALYCTWEFDMIEESRTIYARTHRRTEHHVEIIDWRAPWIPQHTFIPTDRGEIQAAAERVHYRRELAKNGISRTITTDMGLEALRAFAKQIGSIEPFYFHLTS